MNKVEELFCNYVDSDEYSELPQDKELERAYDELESDLSVMLEGDWSFIDIEDKINEYGVINAKIGFMNGFKLAMELMTDCVPQVVKQKVGDVA